MDTPTTPSHEQLEAIGKLTPEQLGGLEALATYFPGLTESRSPAIADASADVEHDADASAPSPSDAYWESDDQVVHDDLMPGQVVERTYVDPYQGPGGLEVTERGVVLAVSFQDVHTDPDNPSSATESKAFAHVAWLTAADPFPADELTAL